MSTNAASHNINVVPLSLDSFLASVQRRAYRMALLATHENADAPDIVQDAMMKLAHNYQGRPAQEWPALFQRILQNRIMDWHRQRSRRHRWLPFLNRDSELDNEDNLDGLFEEMTEQPLQDPAKLLDLANDMEVALKAVEALPIRQQQAFLLRAWEGFDVANTAAAMGCSEGSVKTHYHRAVNNLRQTLLEHCQ